MRLIDADALVADTQFFDGHEWHYGYTEDEIKEAPTIHAPRWVRCEDGMPKPRFAREWYLVALESGCVETLAFERDTNEWWKTGSPVTHWMPLPEPPKEDA